METPTTALVCRKSAQEALTLAGVSKGARKAAYLELAEDFEVLATLQDARDAGREAAPPQLV